MTKKYHMRKRNLKGGDIIGQSLSNLGNSIALGASSIWNKTKKLVGIDDNSGSTYAPSTGSSNYTTSNTMPLSSNSSDSSYKYGGKRGRRGRKTRGSRKMKRGGSSYVSNSSLTNLAATASPFSGVTAKVAYVGGRRKKTRRSRR